MVVDEPQIVVFKGSFKLAAEPRGVARSAALAAAEMVLVSLYCCDKPLFDPTRQGRHAHSSSVSCVTIVAFFGMLFSILKRPSHLETSSLYWTSELRNAWGQYRRSFTLW